MYFESNLTVDIEWMRLLGYDLERFRKVKPNVYAARCPFCGDSKKSATKTRLFFYQRSHQLFVTCKNCGYGRTFFNFVRDFSPNKFEEYKRETLFDMLKHRQAPKNDDEPVNIPNTKPDFEFISQLKNTVKCTDLDEDHPAKQYLYGRHFTHDHMKRLLYTEDFKSVAEQVNPDSSKNLRENEPRIVIPFYNEDEKIQLIQGRSLEGDCGGFKYITIKAHDDVEKVYGRDSIDPSKTVYVVEGPFDSLFVENCIATCDSNLAATDADVLIYDNQPRNEDVVKYMKRALQDGRKVVIWPNSPNDKLDINDMIEMGIDEKTLMEVIRECTYSGLEGLLKFSQWAKC